MKNITQTLFSILFVAALLAGCKESNSDSSLAFGNSPAVIQTASVELSENQTEVYGKVTSIVGNEVVLQLGEKQQATAGDSTSADSKSGTQQNSESKDGFPAMGNGEMPSGSRPDGNFSGTRPEGQGGFSAGDGNMPQRQSNASSTNIDYTDQNETYLIPVGLTISGGTARTSDFSSITEGMTLRLILETFEDNTTGIVAVEIV